MLPGGCGPRCVAPVRRAGRSTVHLAARTGIARPYWITGTARSSWANMPASGCRASCETGLAVAYFRAVIWDRGGRPEVRQSWPTSHARRPRVSSRGGPPSSPAGCAGSGCSSTRWCPMAAVLAATSGGIAEMPGHAPNAGPRRGARHGPPGLTPGVALSQPLYPAQRGMPDRCRVSLAASPAATPG